MARMVRLRIKILNVSAFSVVVLVNVIISNPTIAFKTEHFTIPHLAPAPLNIRTIMRPISSLHVNGSVRQNLAVHTKISHLTPVFMKRPVQLIRSQAHQDNLPNIHRDSHNKETIFPVEQHSLNRVYYGGHQEPLRENHKPHNADQVKHHGNEHMGQHGMQHDGYQIGDHKGHDGVKYGEHHNTDHKGYGAQHEHHTTTDHKGQEHHTAHHNQHGGHHSSNGHESSHEEPHMHGEHHGWRGHESEHEREESLDGYWNLLGPIIFPLVLFFCSLPVAANHSACAFYSVEQYWFC